MRGKLNIKRVDTATGEEEVVYEAYNQLTEGIKHAVVNVLTGTGSTEVDDYKFSYYQLGNQKYDLSTYDISGDLTSSAFKSYFWTLKSPLSISEYGRDSKFATSQKDIYFLGGFSSSGLGTSKFVDNFVQPPDIRTINNEYTNTFGMQVNGEYAYAPLPLNMSSCWINGCVDTWVDAVEQAGIAPMLCYEDSSMSGPDFKAPTWRLSYTDDRYLVNSEGEASFNTACVRANHAYVYKHDTASHKKGELMTIWVKLKKDQTSSAYYAGVHYLSGGATVSSTNLTGRHQIFSRYNEALISTQAGQNRVNFLYRYDYDDTDVTYTPIILNTSSGWQNNEVISDSLIDFSGVYGLSSEEEYGTVSGNVYNRYGPMYTYADHLNSYSSTNGAGASYSGTANAGFGPSGNFYRVSLSWVNAADKMINFYKVQANGYVYDGNGLVPFEFPIVSSVSGSTLTSALNTPLGLSGPIGHEWPETTPRVQAYLSFLQWDYNATAQPNQYVHAESSYYLSKPQYFVNIPSSYTTRLNENTANTRLVVDADLANSQTIKEVGIFLKNPGGSLGGDEPYLAAYKALEYPLNKTDQFSYIIDWEFAFTDVDNL